MAKRRLINLLPGVLQTDPLKKFFGSTVDQVFQPGSAEKITGYIGQRPSYTRAERDFYLTETTAIRHAHQLEPTLIRYDANQSINDIFTHDDLVDYIRACGGVVCDQNRLFSDYFYSWAPPIDIDKISNFSQYVWFGDAPDLIPTLTLTSPSRTVVADGTSFVFDLPAAIAGIDPAREQPMVFVDTRLAEFERQGERVALVYTPAADASVIIYRYGSLRPLIEGAKRFDPTPFIAPSLTVTALSSNMRIALSDGNSLYRGYGTLPFEASLVHATDGSSYQDNPWDPNEATTMYFVEGVGQSIVLVPFYEEPSQDAKRPIHVTIDRRSSDINPWSRDNYWVHRDSFAWSDLTFNDRRATRPIIEFVPEIELYDYGRNRLPDIHATLTGDPYYCPVVFHPQIYNRPVSDWNVLAYDTVGYESPGFSFLPLASANGKAPGTLQVDGQRRIVYGDRVLVLDNPNPELSGRILTVAKAVVTRNGRTTEVMALTAGEAPQAGDIVRMPMRGFIPFDDQYGFDVEPFDYSPLPIEYVYDGSKWTIAQSRGTTNSDPLFNLYTDEHVAHGDVVGSRFAGSRIFGFAKGTVTANVDPVLNRVLAYDASGKIVFENDLVTRPTATSSGSSLPGYAFYKRGSIFENGWYLTNQRSVQGVSDEKVYSIPLNLTANADNEEVETISLGQYLDHYTAILSGQTGFTGSAYRDNNWRDTARDLSKGRSILQHRSPMLKTMLLASDRTFDVFDAIRFADAEYARFRTKFVAQIGEVLRNGQRVVEERADAWVETILRNLSSTKTNEFPWALSRVAGGQFFLPPTAACLGLATPVVPGVEIDDTYEPPVRFLRGHDGSRTPLFGDLRDPILLALENRIYASIPAAFKTDASPAFDFWNHRDGRFRVAAPGATCSSGTDGSGACADSLPGSYTDTGEEVVYTYPTVTDATLRYTREEYVRIYAPMFLRWAQLNQLDYRLNTGWIANDPFTWNFSGVADRFGTPMPGSWRAIYRFYYDTDRPHLAPWEMLGFANKPDWWDAEYGPAPYTRSNTPLWTDLMRGMIRQGARTGIDARFARPALMSVLPVDEAGDLLDPMAAGIITTTPTYQQATQPWAVGDLGPVETLWMMSTSFGFAMAQIGALMRPAAYIEAGWETLDLRRQDAQWFSGRTHNRPRAASLTVHGETGSDGLPVAVLGLQQWIVEMMISRAQAPSLLGNALRGMSAQLAHKMGGFTQSQNLKVFADNFGIVPPEDITVIYHESPPIREVFYSGVIIEWTGSGWRVVGYDTMHNSFCTMPGEDTGPTMTIKAGPDDPQVYEWRPNAYYPINRIVEYQGSTYRAVASHTSGPKFEPEFWAAAANVLRRTTPTVVVPLIPTGEIVSVDYNTVFDTYQDVANFLSAYGRYLVAVGFVFDGTDPVTGEVHDWNQAIREFLIWAQMDWEPGNFIAVSPGAAKLRFVSQHGTVYNVEDQTNGFYGLVDRTGRPIPPKSTFITRLDEDTQILTENNDLYGARLKIGEIEHVLVLNNRTLFNDVIYQPLFNLRQPRLRLNGLRSTPWAGRRDAPGYVIMDDTLMASFEKAAADLRTAYEVEGTDDRTLRDYARHMIGFESRPYLDNLLISDTSQFEFFQGAIRAKGTPGVLDRLTRSTRVDADSDLQFLEEWAFKAGRFGAVNRATRISLTLTRDDLRMSPQLILFGEALGPTDPVLRAPAGDPRWINQPADVLNVFPERTDPATEFTTIRGFDMEPAGTTPFDLDPVAGGPLVRVRQGFLRTPGYVRITEVDYTAFTRDHLDTLSATYTELLNSGSRIWVYDASQNGFDVLFAQTIAVPNNSDDNAARAVQKFVTMNEDQTLDGETRIVFTLPHGLKPADVGGILGIGDTTLTTPDLRGFHVITKIESDTAILIDAAASYGYDYSAIAFDPNSVFNTEADQDPSPSVYLMRSQRFADLAARDAEASRFAPQAGQYAYVDNGGSGRWAVYLYDETAKTYTLIRTQPNRIDTGRLANALIYNQRDEVADKTLKINELRVDGITVLDPVSGFIPGLAEREITYKTEYDPARYDEAQGDVWGREKIGVLWWNLSTVRYLDPLTDVISDGDLTRKAKEINYRINNWARMAPGSSMDIYEWTRATSVPDATTSDLLDPSNITYVTRREFDQATKTFVTAYYFWLRNPATLPVGCPARQMPALEVATMLADPRGADLPWIAPISANGLMIGGIEHYVDGPTTALQFEIIDPTIDGVVHTEYELVRPDDQRSKPPENLWTVMRDSLVGFDADRQTVPDPNLPPAEMIGTSTRPRRTLFANGDEGRRMARRTFVTMVNRILGATNRLSTDPDLIGNLTLATPAFADLINSRIEGRPFDRPPLGSYDFVVNTLAERDALLVSHAFAVACGYKPFDSFRFDDGPFDQDYRLEMLPLKRAPRILLQNYAVANPTWSIWEIDLTASLGANPSQILHVARGYDLAVADRTELADVMAIAPVAIGERVLIRSDARAHGFWTIQRYFPSLPQADADGFVYEGAQTYATSDFVKVVDWYGTAKITDAPVVVYADAKARDLAEGPAPTNLFVKLLDDGTGRWAWTRFNGSKWLVVARARATVALSEAFYAPDRVRYAQGLPDLSDLAARDGAWELQVLINRLYEVVLTNEELNEVFFAILHFVHTQQNEVTFAFKTSFLTVLGGGESIGQTPILTLDNTENLLQYVDEVKPYRVKTRDYTKLMRPDIDTIDMAATDFDKPLYFDEILQKYRRLDLNNPVDRIILSTTAPWDDWYAVFGAKVGQAGVVAASPVRKMTVGLAFDRVDPLKRSPRDATHALARMLAYYEPGLSMVARNAEALFGGSNIVVSGGDAYIPTDPDNLSEFDIRPFDLLPFDVRIATDADTILANGENPLLVFNPDDERKAYGLIDPYHNPENPQELLGLTPNDNLIIKVGTEWTLGQPIQSVVHHDVHRETATRLTLSYGDLAQANDAVLVYRDGVRAAEGTDYTVDAFARTVTVERAGAQSIMISTFGTAGLAALVEQVLVDGGQGSYPLRHVPRTTFEVIEDGVRMPTGVAAINGNQISLTPAPTAGTDVMINVYASDAGIAATATHVVRESLPAVRAQTWTLATPTSLRAPVGPAHLRTIVEYMGLTLTPAFTRYGYFSPTVRLIPFRAVADLSQVSVLLDGVPYTGGIGRSIADGTPLILSGGSLIAVDPTLMAHVVIIVDQTGRDYTITENGQLRVERTLTVSDYDVYEGGFGTYGWDLNDDFREDFRLETTTFTNADLMEIETHVFQGATGGAYTIDSEVAGPDYVWVTLDGKRQRLGDDFTVHRGALGFGDEPWGYVFDSLDAATIITLHGDQNPWQRVVVRAFTGRPARDASVSAAITARPAMTRMGSRARGGDYDQTPFDTVGLDTITAIYRPSSLGMRPVYRMDGGFEILRWTEERVGALTAPLDAGATTISLRVNPYGRAGDLIPADPLPLPDPQTGRPGAIWVNGERIEYWGLTRSGLQITLDGLRRGTRGTHGPIEDRLRTLRVADGIQTTFRLDNASISIPVEVAILSGDVLIAQSLGAHYALSQVEEGVLVVFNTAPTAGTTIVLGQSLPAVHAAGSLVHSAIEEDPAYAGPFYRRDLLDYTKLV